MEAQCWRSEMMYANSYPCIGGPMMTKRIEMLTRVFTVWRRESKHAQMRRVPGCLLVRFVVAILNELLQAC